MIFIGMIAALAVALFFSLRSRLLFPKLGVGLSALIACVGLAYFRWRPFFGGGHSIDTWGGFGALCLGLFGFCLFGAMDEIARRLAAAPDPRPESPAAVPATRPAP